MSTFAVTNSDQILDSVNYLLSNLGQTGNATGNVTIPTGTLIGNTTTGIVTPYNTGGNAYSYLYQWVNLRYANNATGSSGFSSVPTNSGYFGVYNSVLQTASLNPTDYSWYEVAGGFSTTKTIYYSAIGGRQVLFAAANSAPNPNYQVSTANVAIDLDVVTTAAGTPGERGPVAMAYVITTADPTAASSSTLSGWFSSSRTANTPPIGTGLTPVVSGDTAYFTYPTTGVSETYSFNGSAWQTAEGQVVSGATIVANTTPGNAIIISTITGNLIAANTITGNTIQVSTITGNLIAANTITGNTIQASTITGNLIAANTITATNIAANTITANQIAANTITANQISSSYIYAGNIVSFGATLNSNTSTGYWLNYSTGNARFGGNVSIGSNLDVSGLITTGALIANTVDTTQLNINSATTVLFQGGSGTTTTYPVSYFNTVGNINWPYNTRGFAIPAVAIRPTTDGSSSGSSILATFTAGVQCDSNNDYNIVELWRTGADIAYGNVFNSVSYAVGNSTGVVPDQMYITGTSPPGPFNTIGSILGVSTDNGNTWGFNTSPNSSIGTQAVSSIAATGFPTYNSVFNRSSTSTISTSQSTFGGPSGSWALVPSGQFLNTNKVLFTGNEIGNASSSNDIGILTGQAAFSMYYRPYNWSGSSGPATQQQLTVPVNFFSDIYDMTAAYAQVGNTQVKNAVFACTGGDILTTQFQFHSSNAAVTNTTLTLRLTPTDSNLVGVSADLSTAPPTAWIAVGEAGVIVRSTDNGATWASVTSPTEEYLRSVVGYGGDATKRFVAVGDSGTIIHSNDGGVTWTAGTVPLTSDAVIRDLKSVAFSPRGGAGNAGQWTAVGQGVIYKCNKASTTWTIAYQENAAVSGSLKRLVSIGSNFGVFDNTLPSSAQQIGNTVVNSTYQDTDYNNTLTYQYYVVIGNMNSATGMNARFPSLTLQEIKR